MSLTLGRDDIPLAAAFATLKSRNDVASLLEITPAQLRFYLFRAANYKTFELSKRCGGKRLIHSPFTPLKIIQRKLNQVLQAVYRGRSPAHGFARGRSIRSNALRHFGCMVLLNFDLEDFFPTIHFGRVMALFESKPYFLPRGAALALAQICCHNRTLPAGAPTSPVVANMICAQMDSQLKVLARQNNCVFTRYADDITISSTANKLPNAIATFDAQTQRWIAGPDVTAIVVKNGFSIHPTKTRVLHRSDRQEITGLLIYPRLNVKRQFIRQARAMLHAWEKWGEVKATSEFLTKYDKKQRQKGVVDFKRGSQGKNRVHRFVRGRDDTLFLSLLGRYAVLDNKAKIRPVTVTNNATYQVLAQSIWLLEGDEHMENATSATAFALEGYGLVTAAHNLTGTLYASQPHIHPGKRYKYAVVPQGSPKTGHIGSAENRP